MLSIAYRILILKKIAWNKLACQDCRVDTRDKKQLQTYQNLSTELYELDKPVVSEEEFAFYMSYVKKSKGPILEPMCGSGRFLIPLIEAGFIVDGFDASRFMLEAFYKKCAERKITITETFSKCKIWQTFFQDLNSPQRYNLVFIPDGSFNLILNTEEIGLCLHKIYEHLQDGGRFVFELVTMNYAKQIEIGALTFFSKTRADGNSITQRIEVLSFEKQVVRTISHYKPEFGIRKITIHSSPITCIKN